ncbi:MAG: hypothetical protein ABJN84_17820 [Flavobacteriaceae bacterium]
MNKLDTSNPNNYKYETKHLEIHILGGMKTNKLETLRITLSVQKPKQHNVLRHNIDLYNDNQVEKFTRKIAERLEIGTSVTSSAVVALLRRKETNDINSEVKQGIRQLSPSCCNFFCEIGFQRP